MVWKNANKGAKPGRKNRKNDGRYDGKYSDIEKKLNERGDSILNLFDEAYRNGHKDKEQTRAYGEISPCAWEYPVARN
jgi:hypothetical protein